jgi:hypothetical protein
MAWPNPFAKRDERRRATANDIGRMFAAYTEERARTRIREIREQSDSESPRFRQMAFAVEVLLFEAFLIDLILFREFERHRDAIRGHYAEWLMQAAHELGMSNEYDETFDRLREDRFAEYAEAVRAGLEQLGRVATKRIMKTDVASLPIHMLLFMTAGTTLKGFQKIIDRFEIVE